MITTKENKIEHAFDTERTRYVTLTLHFRACPDLEYKDSLQVHTFLLVGPAPDSVICLQDKPVLLYNHHPGKNGDSKMQILNHWGQLVFETTGKGANGMGALIVFNYNIS